MMRDKGETSHSDITLNMNKLYPLNGGAYCSENTWTIKFCDDDSLLIRPHIVDTKSYEASPYYFRMNHRKSSVETSDPLISICTSREHDSEHLYPIYRVQARDICNFTYILPLLVEQESQTLSLDTVSHHPLAHDENKPAPASDLFVDAPVLTVKNELHIRHIFNHIATLGSMQNYWEITVRDGEVTIYPSIEDYFEYMQTDYYKSISHGADPIISDVELQDIPITFDKSTCESSGLIIIRYKAPLECILALFSGIAETSSFTRGELAAAAHHEMKVLANTGRTSPTIYQPLPIRPGISRPDTPHPEAADMPRCLLDQDDDDHIIWRGSNLFDQLLELGDSEFNLWHCSINIKTHSVTMKPKIPEVVGEPENQIAFLSIFDDYQEKIQLLTQIMPCNVKKYFDGQTKSITWQRNDFEKLLNILDKINEQLRNDPSMSFASALDVLDIKLENVTTELKSDETDTKGKGKNKGKEKYKGKEKKDVGLARLATSRGSFRSESPSELTRSPTYDFASDEEILINLLTRSASPKPESTSGKTSDKILLSSGSGSDLGSEDEDFASPFRSSFSSSY